MAWTTTDFSNYVGQVIGRRLLGYADIAKLFPVSLKTLYNDRSRGLLIPINELAKQPLFDIGAVEAWARLTHRI